MGSQRPIKPGDVLDGKYEIVRELGAGAMGLVFMARHTSLGKSVAVKTLRAEIAASADLVGRFEQEARAASAIGHPNIVEVFDLGSSDSGLRYMVMEHLDGQSLAELLETTRVLMPGRAVNIASQVLSALAAAHASGIVHRDLKPENIFITHHHDNPEFVKLLDFGISKVLDVAAPHIGGGMKMTRFGEVIGTPLYMSPEQAAGRPDLDHRTDLWSVGCVIYEMLTGVTPYDGENYNQIMGAILKGEFKRPRQVRPAMPEAIELVILKALAQDRDARYHSASAMREALVASLAQGSISTTPPPSGVLRAAPQQTQSDVGTEMLGSAAGDASVGDAEQALANALDNLDVGAIGFAGDEPSSAPPPAVAAVTTPPVSSPAAAPAAAPADLFAPPEAQQEASQMLSLDRSVIGRSHAASPPQRPMSPSAPRLSAGNTRGRAAATTVRTHSGGAGVGTVLKVVIVIAALGGGGFFAYQHFNKPEKPTLVAVEFRIVPADAEVFVAGETLTMRPLMAEVGRPYDLEFRAPGRMTAKRTITPSAADTMAVSVRLPLAMVPIDRLALRAAHDASAGGDDARGKALYQDVDKALEKLSLYARCLGPLAEPLADSLDAYRKTSSGGRIRRGHIPIVKALPTQLISECRLNLANAIDRKPVFESLDASARKLLAELNTVVPLLTRLSKYYSQREYGDDGFKLGRRKHAELRKGLDALTALHKGLFSSVMVSRMYWQQRELDTIAASEGLGAHWQLRRVVMASQAWVWSRLSGASAGKQKAALDQLVVVYEAALGFSRKDEAAMARIGFAQDYFAAAKIVFEFAKRSASGEKFGVDDLLARHNASVKAFNAMTL